VCPSPFWRMGGACALLGSIALNGIAQDGVAPSRRLCCDIVTCHNIVLSMVILVHRRASSEVGQDMLVIVSTPELSEFASTPELASNPELFVCLVGFVFFLFFVFFCFFLWVFFKKNK
jgi:hypothetical protein